MTGTTAAAGRLGSARLAAQGVFAVSGLLVASWASRIPQVSDQLGLRPATLGAVLFTQAAGGLLAAPLAGAVVARSGVRRATALSGIVLGLGLALTGVGSSLSVLVTVAGLVLLGAGVGLGDVAMTVHLTGIEQTTGASLLPRAYGWFGVGGLAGAALGATCTATGVGPSVHLVAVGVVAGAAITWASGTYLDVDGSGEPAPRRRSWATRVVALRTSAALGLVSAAFAFAESAGSVWIGVSLREDRGQSLLVCSIAYGSFVAAVVLGRFVLPPLVAGVTPSTRLRASALAVVGACVVLVETPSPAVAVLAAALWGIGSSLGIPTALQLAGREPRGAASRIAVVTTCMYVAYLVAPPLIGVVGEHVATSTALLAVVPLLLAAVLVRTPRAQPADPVAASPVAAAPAAGRPRRRPSGAPPRARGEWVPSRPAAAGRPG